MRSLYLIKWFTYICKKYMYIKNKWKSLNRSKCLLWRIISQTFTAHNCLLKQLVPHIFMCFCCLFRPALYGCHQSKINELLWSIICHFIRRTESNSCSFQSQAVWYKCNTTHVWCCGRANAVRLSKQLSKYSNNKQTELKWCPPYIPAFHGLSSNCSVS